MGKVEEKKREKEKASSVSFRPSFLTAGTGSHLHLASCLIFLLGSLSSGSLRSLSDAANATTLSQIENLEKR